MSKEKQIEEMAQIIGIPCYKRIEEYGDGSQECPSPLPCNECTAELLYNAGYRKQIEGEWIRAENPPEEYRDEYGELIPFLVCCKGTVYPFRAMYDGTNWGDGIGVLKVTHWMPLPEPPKANP
jgi:hypothetical protein